jgi:hypothetical protein
MMYDQAFSETALGHHLRRSDFVGVPSANVGAFRALVLAQAIAATKSQFATANPLRSFHVRQKKTYGLVKLENELVARKLTSNLREQIGPLARGRDFIVKALIRILEEATPYRVYRLDVAGFYESIDLKVIARLVFDHSSLSPLSKKLLANLMNHFQSMGGTGVPRGMALSAVLAELVMQPFDKHVCELQGVFFYARYVDDILIVSSAEEDKIKFLETIRNALPAGLHLNNKTETLSLTDPLTKKNPGKYRDSVEYLGYTFSVWNPPASTSQPAFRRVLVDVAKSKVEKFKLRIGRSFRDYLKTNDFALLHDRIRLMTSNFRIVDKDSGRGKLAGIYHGYPRLTADAPALRELDAFIKAALLQAPGRLFGQVRARLNGAERRALLALSFATGHRTKRFVHMHPKRIGEIQRCWSYD